MSTLEVGSNRLVIGIVQRIVGREGMLDPESLHVNPENYSPIGRMQSPHWYCHTTDMFELVRPE